MDESASQFSTHLVTVRYKSIYRSFLVRTRLLLWSMWWHIDPLKCPILHHSEMQYSSYFFVTDPMNELEDASERWSPVHTVESIILSIISLLSAPGIDSPANVDAAKEWRDNRPEFKKKVARIVRKSQEML